MHVNKRRIFCIWIFLTFSRHKFSVPDFYLLSTLCGPAATPWIWGPHYKRVKVNISSFGISKTFSLLKIQRNWKESHCCVECQQEKYFRPRPTIRLLPLSKMGSLSKSEKRETHVFVSASKCTLCFPFRFSVPLIGRLSSLLKRESVFKLFQ